MNIYTIIMNKNTTKHRHQVLKKIIQEQEISDQTDLLSAFKQEGIETTQATVSRDIQKLKIVKVRVRPGVYKYQQLDQSVQTSIDNRLKLLFENFVFDILSTNNLIVIKTAPGNANSVSSVIDELNIPGVLGTVAGDDTILVITESNSHREKIERDFKDILDHDV